MVTSAIAQLIQGALVGRPAASANFLERSTTGIPAIVTGDFNGDGKTDVALTGAADRGVRVPVAFSDGDGTFTATQV